MDSHSLAGNRDILLLSSRSWNDGLGERLRARLQRSVTSITASNELSFSSVSASNPQWIFVPHWSQFIPKAIWSNWPTVIFHMSDLPYGRGGSPLQNLIQRGITSTMITAFRCCEDFDAGDVYLKEPLYLYGSAEEIFIRADSLIEKMIEFIVKEEPIPTPQQGDPVVFTRRSPPESNLAFCPDGSLHAWFDMIRMLDAQGYPHAFIEINGIRLEFRRVSQRTDGLHADVKIICNHSS